VLVSLGVLEVIQMDLGLVSCPDAGSFVGVGHSESYWDRGACIRRKQGTIIVCTLSMAVTMHLLADYLDGDTIKVRSQTFK